LVGRYLSQGNGNRGGPFAYRPPTGVDVALGLNGCAGVQVKGEARTPSSLQDLQVNCRSNSMLVTERESLSRKEVLISRQIVFAFH